MHVVQGNADPFDYQRTPGFYLIWARNVLYCRVVTAAARFLFSVLTNVNYGASNPNRLVTEIVWVFPLRYMTTSANDQIPLNSTVFAAEQVTTVF
jgi:hypothetical protein